MVNSEKPPTAKNCTASAFQGADNSAVGPVKRLRERKSSTRFFGAKTLSDLSRGLKMSPLFGPPADSRCAECNDARNAPALQSEPPCRSVAIVFLSVATVGETGESVPDCPYPPCLGSSKTESRAGSVHSSPKKLTA